MSAMVDSLPGGSFDPPNPLNKVDTVDIVRNDQALPDDPPPDASIPIGVLIIGALGWLVMVVGLLILPWPLPGAQPTVAGTQLSRLFTSVPDEGVLLAVTRRLIDVIPYIFLILVPIFLVLAAGRRTRSAARGLAVVGVLGVLYALGMALYFGPMIYISGFLLITVSGLLALGLPPAIARSTGHLPAPLASESEALPVFAVPARPESLPEPIPEHFASDPDSSDLTDSQAQPVVTPSDSPSLRSGEQLEG